MPDNTPTPDLSFIERDWLSSNQVLFFDADGATVLDTGYAKHADLTVALVRRELQARGGMPLTGVVNTHLHSDHCGGNAALTRAFAADAPGIAIPAAEAGMIAAWDEATMHHTQCGQRLERFAATATVSPGDELRLGGEHWNVHAAPGHDPRSLILHSPASRTLISADALWENGYGITFPELAGESGFAEQRAVLDLIAGLDVERVLPGHGPAFGDVRSALQRAYKRVDAQIADPHKHARYAIKALMVFQMLDREQADVAELRAAACASLPVRQACALLGEEPGVVVDTVIAELVAQRVLGRDGDRLRCA